MLFEQRFWPLLADGSLTVTFRRWRRPQAVAGRRYRTPASIVEAERVDVVTAESITDADARRSGYPSAATVVNDLRGEASSPIYRVQFHLVDGEGLSGHIRDTGGNGPGQQLMGVDVVDEAAPHEHPAVGRGAGEAVAELHAQRADERGGAVAVQRP